MSSTSLIHPHSKTLGESDRRRPRVLLIPNTATWIIGEMAEQIINHFGQDYEFWCGTDKLIRFRPDLIRALAPNLDFVFPLTDKGFQLFERAIAPLTVPSIFWVHHVSSWNASMCDAVSRSSELIACTEDWKHRIQGRCSQHASITVVRHGVEIDQFRRVSAARPRLGMPEDGFVIGFVGSRRSDADCGRKGLDTLEAVLETVKNQVPNLHVSFLGLGWDQQVERLRQKGISANYAGFVPQTDLPVFYSSIDLYLMTSRMEGGPCTVLEAMACQTPVVATRVGLVPQTIADNINGFTAEVDDVESLARSIALLASDAEFRKSIGIAARQRVTENLSWDSTLASLTVPLNRMASLSPQSSGTGFLHLPPSMAIEFCRAVHVLDVVLSAISDFCRGWSRPKVALSMLTACLKGFQIRDLMSALGLALRISFKPSLFRKHV